MKPRHLVPADIKDRHGNPLPEHALANVFHESHKLSRRITALEVLNIKGSLVKPVYNEVSEELSRINAVIAEEPEGTFRWQRLDNTRSKLRGFYNTCKQVWAIRQSEYLQSKGQVSSGKNAVTTDQLIDQLMHQAKADHWSDQLLYLRITRTIDQQLSTKQEG